jgi:PAS domain S-box-containing protein
MADPVLQGESGQFNKQVVASVQEGFIVVDRDLRYSVWNPAMEQMSGLPAEKVIGKHPQELFPFREEAGVYPLLQRALAGETVDSLEFPYEVPSSGQKGWASQSMGPLRSADGEIIGAIVTVREITQKKQTGAALRQAQKLESLGILAGGIAHDFNNLLTVMLGYASLAALHLPGDSPARPMLAEIENAARQAADLTQQMLAYSGRGKVVTELLSLDELVGEMDPLLQTVVSKKADFRLDLEPAAIEGDAAQVRQVVLNLVTNASEALAGQPGTVTVRTGTRALDADALHSPYLQQDLPPGSYALLEVSDSGCGMSEETLGKIFDPFFTTKFTGRGLGLAAVLGIVRSHRGTLRVASTPGRGTTFQVFLPAAAQAAGDGPAARPADQRPRVGGTVLVIEDEESVRLFTAQVLEEAGFKVLLAGDGFAGVEVFRADRDEVRAVVLDLRMPRLDGWEVMARLRGLRGDVPMLLVSGYNEPELPPDAANLAVAGFLQKPFRPRDLIACVCRMAPWETS